MLRFRKRISDTDRKRNAERDRLLRDLFDSRVGSETEIKARATLDEFDRQHQTVVRSAFDPDARL